MRRFVFWTGVYNVLSGITFIVPGSLKLLGINLPGPGWPQIVGVLVVYLGIVLIICSRDLSARAPLVCWEGVARIMVFLLAVGYALFRDAGVVLALIGVLELLIGLFYLIGLPRTLRTSLADLLLDRR